MNHHIKYLLFLFTLQSCNYLANSPKNPIKDKENPISKKLLLEIKNSIGKKPIRFEKVNYYYKKIDSTWIEEIDTIRNGIYFPKISEDKAKKIVEKYFDRCSKFGAYIFLKNLDFDKNWHSIYDVAIIKAKDQYEVLKMMNTQGVNYNITNNMVINKLKEWDKQVGLKILIAQEDRVEALITKLPENLKDFTSQIYKFCPDVIDQGYGDIEKMIQDYKENKHLWMWWD